MGAKRYESSSLRNNNIINQFLEKNSSRQDSKIEKKIDKMICQKQISIFLDFKVSI
jgi:hypothetical protein